MADDNDFETEETTGSVAHETLVELSERTAVQPGCDHEAVKSDQAAWELLPFVGIQQDWDDDGNEAPLALRNCTCGTTLARRANAVDDIDESIRQLMRNVSRTAATRDVRSAAMRAVSATRCAEYVSLAETMSQAGGQ